MIFVETNAAAISHTTWRITYYYNLREYFENLNKLQFAVDHLEKMCDYDKEVKRECDSFLILLKQHLKDTQISSEKIKSFDRRRNKRETFAPLGIIGDVQSRVFGLTQTEKSCGTE